MTESMLQEQVASDVLATLLGLLPEDEFTGDMEKIHTILARSKRHYPVLNFFDFTTDEVYPFSRGLEDSLNILQRSKMIRIGNPEYRTIEVTLGGKKVANDLLSKFDADKQNQLRQLAQIFWQECGRPDDNGDVTDEAD